MSPLQFPSGSWRRVLPRRVNDEVQAEIDFHLAMAERDAIAAGMSPDDARRAAEEQFGDAREFRRQMKRIDERQQSAARRMQWGTEFARDLLLGFRILRRRPVYAALAVATLALGIGSATALYSLVDAVLLRPLPFPDPERLVSIWLAQPRLREDPVLAANADRTVIGAEEYVVMKSAGTLSHVALWSTSEASVTTSTGTERAGIVRTTSSMLPTLGVRPILGRGFEPTEDVFNGPKVALLDWETWQRRFHGDSTVVGRPLTIDETAYRIVGVLPRDTRLSVTREALPSVWVPAFQEEYDLPERHNRSYRGLGRLRDGVAIEAVHAQLSAKLAPLGTAEWPLAATVNEWHAEQTRDVRRPLWLLLGFASMLLLVACANVALLSLSEAAARGREFATRVALGAGSGRLVRQLISENVALAAAGAAVGCLLATVLIRLLVSTAPGTTPHLASVAMNPHAALFAVTCALVTAVVFGLVPAVGAAREGQRTAGALATRTVTGRSRAQGAFVALQLALSVVLLSGAGLLAASVHNLSRVDVGFRSEGLASVGLLVPRSLQEPQRAIVDLSLQVQRALAAIPGVTAVGGASAVPFSGGSSSSPVQVEGREYTRESPPNNANQVAVTPEYFAAMGIPLRAGRAFTADDREGTELVVVVNETFARREFGGANPLGKRVRYQGKWRPIVGVVGDARARSVVDAPRATVFVPFAQYPYAPTGTPIYAVRSNVSPEVLTARITRALRDVHPELALGKVEALPRSIARTYEEERFRTVLVLCFGAIAMVLVGLGMYGLAARLAVTRTREIGIRAALGAPVPALVRLLMREPSWGLAVGVAVGLVAARYTAAWLEPFLFEVSPGDVRILGSVAVFLALLALAGSLVPSWRAARVPPSVSLSAE